MHVYNRSYSSGKHLESPAGSAAMPPEANAKSLKRSTGVAFLGRTVRRKSGGAEGSAASPTDKPHSSCALDHSASSCLQAPRPVGCSRELADKFSEAAWRPLHLQHCIRSQPASVCRWRYDTGVCTHERHSTHLKLTKFSPCFRSILCSCGSKT